MQDQSVHLEKAISDMGKVESLSSNMRTKTLYLMKNDSSMLEKINMAHLQELESEFHELHLTVKQMNAKFQDLLWKSIDVKHLSPFKRRSTLFIENEEFDKCMPKSQIHNPMVQSVPVGPKTDYDPSQLELKAMLLEFLKQKNSGLSKCENCQNLSESQFEKQSDSSSEDPRIQLKGESLQYLIEKLRLPSVDNYTFGSDQGQLQEPQSNRPDNRSHSINHEQKGSQVILRGDNFERIWDQYIGNHIEKLKSRSEQNSHSNHNQLGVQTEEQQYKIDIDGFVNRVLSNEEKPNNSQLQQDILEKKTSHPDKYLEKVVISLLDTLSRVLKRLQLFAPIGIVSKEADEIKRQRSDLQQHYQALHRSKNPESPHFRAGFDFWKFSKKVILNCNSLCRAMKELSQMFYNDELFNCAGPITLQLKI